MKRFVAPLLVFLLYRLLMLTWRVDLREPEAMKQAMRERRPFILAHWHGDELALLQFLRRYNIGTIVSQSEDGEIMNKFIRWMGATTSRGSSTRGGVGALKGLIRLVRQGHNCSFAVDGPKGPIYKAKPGVFEVSRALQLPMYYCGVACDQAIRFPRSWNQTYLPKPFARIRVEWQGPLSPVAESADPRSPEVALELETRLHAAKQQALTAIAEPGGRC